MTDVPPDSGAPGAQPAQPWDPSGIRRSSYTPPPVDAEPPTFDDDALADAMAAEVSPYTSEIKLPHLLPPAGAEFGVATSEPAQPEAATPEPAVAAVAEPIPLVEPARFLDSATTADTSPITAATGTVSSSENSPEDELRRALGGASTLEAMQRLEEEVRRISNGEPPSIDVPAVNDESAAVPASSGRSPDTDVFSWLSATTVAPAASAASAAPTSSNADVPPPADADASVFDIPPIAEAAPEPPSSQDDAEVDEPIDGPPLPAEVDPLAALALGGAWVASTPEEFLDEPSIVLPLPGTDALGWNTPVTPEEAEPEEAEPEEAEPEEAEPEAGGSAPREPLPASLGTQVWSLFPDEGVESAAPTESDSEIEPESDSESRLESESPTTPPESPTAFAWLFPATTADVAPIDEPRFPFGDPAADDPDGAPVAFESLATATAAIPVVTHVPLVADQQADVPESSDEWEAPAPEPEPEPESEPESEPEPTPEPAASSFPGLSPVDESLIDPDAAAAAAAATLGGSLAAPVPTPVPVEPWTVAPTPDDGVWDLGAMPEAAPAESAPIDPVPAPAPTVLPPEAGLQFGLAVPISTEPPVGPESPDWLDAPPPVYSPPELVEPQQVLDSGPNPTVDPVPPITANTMARLPVPLPSEVPNIADRAELPPPPGYEDIPIMSSDAAAQAAMFSPILFAPAMSSPFTPPLSEPLLPVPPSAPPVSENSVPAQVDLAADPGNDESFPSDTAAADAPGPEVGPEVGAIPFGVAAGETVGVAAVSPRVPEATESASLDDEDDDAIDEVDRVGSAAAVPVSAAVIVASPAGAAGVVAPPAEPIVPPAEPMATARLDENQQAIVDGKPRVSAIEVESAGVEPTALDLRTGRAARLFWLWFAANSSVVSLGLGAVLLSSGMSLRQSIVATLAGVAISFLPLGLGTLAGKWSGQPTMVVSRAAFGHAGNILPAALAVITRVFWGGVLLWLLATAVAQVLVGAGLDAGLGTQLWQLVGLVVGFVIATVVAVFGYGFVAKLQLVLSIVNALLILGAAALTFQRLDFAAALTVPDGSWVLAIGGAAIVFSVIGLAWVHSSSDLARYQRPGSSGGASMLWATFGATLPPFLLICWGAMLAASDPALASGLQTNPLAAIATLLPAWYPAPLLAAASLGLLSGVVLTIYSGGFAVQALGLKQRRSMTTLISAILVLAAAATVLFLVPDFTAVVRSVIITIAVPVAAWAGIFAAEMMIRTRRFHTPSLLAPGGIYPQVRWLNLIALVVISAVSYGFVTSNVFGFQWEGFLFRAFGVASADPFGASNVGVFLALLLGLVVPLVGGVSAIRRQEAIGQEEAQPLTSVPTISAPIVTAAPAAISAPAAPPLTPEPTTIPSE